MAAVSSYRSRGRGQDVIDRGSGVELQVFDGRQRFVGGTDLTRRVGEILGSPESGVEPATPWRGQPWLTPVLGSGPLGLPTEFVANADALPEAVLRAVTTLREAAAFDQLGAAIEDWLPQFIRAMTEQRIGDERASDRAAELRPTRTVDQLAAGIPRSTALVALLAAQLTRTFHRIGLDSCLPLSRWGAHTGELGVGNPRYLDVRDEYVEPLLTVCQGARLALSRPESVEAAPNSAAAISLLIGRIHDGLTAASGPQISRTVVEQTTETMWYLLVDSVVKRAYPGWTSLLLRLVLADEAAEVGRHVRPRWSRLAQLADAIVKIVEPASREAWRLRDSSPEHIENRDFYDAVARTLWAQSHARLGGTSGDDHVEGAKPPRAVAYVSSFDYELEMALWRTATGPGGGRFSVIVPVYAVREGEPNVGDFIWLEATINTARRGDPTAHLDEFDLMRSVESWRVLDRQTKQTEFHDRPLVVRLVGCPLVELPEKSAITGSFAKALSETGRPDVVRFVHAVTVDEYLALRQTERDWAWNVEHSQRQNRGLPTHLLRNHRTVSTAVLDVDGRSVP